ncbi:hypothetical protein ACS0TY_028489 [Phlomoides rotata]
MNKDHRRYKADSAACYFYPSNIRCSSMFFPATIMFLEFLFLMNMEVHGMLACIGCELERDCRLVLVRFISLLPFLANTFDR